VHELDLGRPGPASISQGCQRPSDLLAFVGTRKRHNASMRIERARENVFTVTATSQELSALVAGARMALEAMRAAPEPPPAEALQILERVLGDFDRARAGLTGEPRASG